MKISSTPGIDAIQSVANPNGRNRPAPAKDIESGVADRVSLSVEAQALLQAAMVQEEVAARAADQRFPPASAPAEVRVAWSEATQGMSDMDRLVAEGAFMAEEISANLKYDSAGRAVGIRQHGESGYVDLWNQPGVSYPEQVDRMLEKLEQNQFAHTTKDYAFFHDMLAGFRGALSNHSAT